MKPSIDKFNRLVDAFESLPTIGRKSATRLAYHLCMNDPYMGMKLSHTIESALSAIQKCQKCGCMSEHELCHICVDDMRDADKLCIVQSAKDVLTIEENASFKGRYFVLDALEKPTIDKLIEVVQEGVTEIVFAMTPSIANDAVILFVEDKLSQFDVVFTKIAQGVPTGVSLENVDMLSLSRALEDRVKV